MMTGQRFIISCLQCKRIVAIAGGIVDAEQLAQLSANLRACNPGTERVPSPPVETTLRHFRVEPTDSDELPTDAA